MKASNKPKKSLGEYYSALQLRTDRWTNLRIATEQLTQTLTEKRRLDAERKIRELIEVLRPIELYWAFPGHDTFERLEVLLEEGRVEALANIVRNICRALMSNSYRRNPHHHDLDELIEGSPDDESNESRPKELPYFEVLFVDNFTPIQEANLRRTMASMRRPEDPFVYEPVFVPSLTDALIAVMFNHNVQTVVVRNGLRLESDQTLEILHRYMSRLEEDALQDVEPKEYGPELCRLIAKLRPELDVFLFTDQSVEEIAGANLGNCRRVFYNQEDHLELHLNILRGVSDRFEAPFFTALTEYARKPTGVFHAMPISRGKSITRSHWIKDMGEFYGMNIFLAETSATSGGLDSLLEPHGPIKKAQEKAARAFGAKQTFFSTNGTSTCNKIVVQAIVRPGDIVLVDRDCHKSHHYGMVLAGAQVVYLDSYPLNDYSMYGAVPMREIKHRLLELKAAGKLDRVRMLLLTNCTFDGVVYNVERVMEECLAIKPDLVFLWDEAWFAFARFGPAYRRRTGMHCAALLRERFKSPEYRAAYAKYAEKMADADDETLLKTRLMPDPDKVRVRVYACQSTHKTLTSLRQGSMIHVHDQDFKDEVEQAFHEAYMTHTSTSPNYQIIASLDIGRRQVELEGFEFIQRQVEQAMSLRKAINHHPLISKYFHVLTVAEMIPAEYRKSGIKSYWDPEHGWSDIAEAWSEDEFVLDATRVTLSVSGSGWDGDTFKNQILMDKHGIQINKTSRNTVLFMTNIGTTRSSIAYLIEVLVKIARELDERLDDASAVEKKIFERKVKALREDLPPLPDFSYFHDAFRLSAGNGTPEGDIRSAFFLAYDEGKCEYIPIEGNAIEKEIATGRKLVSTTFVIPYPPGFPILVPGQVISQEIIAFMRALDVTEIHGYRPELGLRIFTETALAALEAKPVIQALQ
ncbi:aminotransferase class I/II-fold pyridoxal phosphate-dependent enzyme [Denitromonas ohlonensis]|uniref:Aminotransferase class I/II-fold pyridoxal phosphate-dependent enzyme n=2 Tax=Denitromonas TaxID=139331 RepID=A0A557S9U6_9RHOO|nr:aminotransferase class I/II-fold pyridoxal phosphate-dependent enzyme [Denitromonas ohlonensis]TVO63668.1 aminotransferase class I/II-fold pyridoxal phosphate-dependent enzyme [Denitromonas ohlonensis]TVO74202.1 aminotransferase class I/II-fold pyridoxal phosphate-dependent enzyme [Denitromonas ohlonensis]